jgi:hypothetical protein
MTDDRDLNVEVHGDEIVVSLPHTHYTVTYYKPSNSPQLLAKRFPGNQLLAKRFPGNDDPDARLTHAEFLAQAWKLANDKARELGWIK